MTAPTPMPPDRAAAAELLYPGLSPEDAYQRHAAQIDRVAAALAEKPRPDLLSQILAVLTDPSSWKPGVTQDLLRRARQ